LNGPYRVGDGHHEHRDDDRYSVSTAEKPTKRRIEKEDRLMTRTSIVRRSFLVILGLLASGCSEELVPEPMPTASVSGTVHRSGEPVGRGWLEFLPVEGTVGRLRSAEIAPDGTFEADSVAVGTVAIRAVGTNLPPAEFGMLSQMFLIRRDVGADGPTVLEIDLYRERRAVPPPGRPG
jgi:hypothetical protein